MFKIAHSQNQPTLFSKQPLGMETGQYLPPHRNRSEHLTTNTDGAPRRECRVRVTNDRNETWLAPADVPCAFNSDREFTAPRFVANGMDRPRSCPRWHSECAGGLSAEGAPSCLACPQFTQ